MNIYNLADEIDAGAHFQRDVSLLALKKTFEKYGLVAEGFKADYPKEIVEFAKPGNILIVRVKSCQGGRDIGHFIVIKGCKEYVLVIDPPYHPKRFTRKDMTEDDILCGSSGEFLVIYKPNVTLLPDKEEAIGGGK